MDALMSTDRDKLSDVFAKHTEIVDLTERTNNKLAIELRLDRYGFSKNELLDDFWNSPHIESLSKIPKASQTREMVEAAIDGECGYVDLLKHASKKVLDYQLCLKACEKCGESYYSVPDRFKTRELTLITLKTLSRAYLKVPVEFIDEEIIRATLTGTSFRSDPDGLFCILERKDYKVDNLQAICNLAVKSHPTSIRYVPKDNLNKRIVEEAISLDPLSLEYVPRCYIDPQLAKAAVSLTDTRFYKQPGFLTISCDHQRYSQFANYDRKIRAFPIQYVPIEYMSQELARLSIEKNPISALVIPEKYLSEDDILNLISVDIENLYEDDSRWESIKGISSKATKAANRRQELRYKPSCLRPQKRIKQMPADVPSFNVAEVPITTKDAELGSYKRSFVRNPRGNVETTHVICAPNEREHLYDRAVIEFSYVSDLHIANQINLIGLQRDKAQKKIRKKINELVKTIPSECSPLLIAGDVCSGSLEEVKLFMSDFSHKMMFKSANYLWESSNLTRLFVLGNHEYWAYQSWLRQHSESEDPRPILPTAATVSMATEWFRRLGENYCFTLLENDLFIEYETGKTRVIPHEILMSCDLNDLKDIIDKSQFAVLGGCGFCKSDKGIQTTSNDDAALNSVFLKTYQKIKECASDKQIVVLTHYPVEECLPDEDLCTNWIYVNGHSHVNSLVNVKGKAVILADNQIGNRPITWGFKSFRINCFADRFSSLIDGIYKISTGEYERFNQLKSILMQRFKQDGEILLLKRSGIYMFLFRPSGKEKIYLLNGGSIRSLNNQDIDYYFENMVKYSQAVKRFFKPLMNVLESISKEVESFGGYGTIHGSIVDIDYYNHIFVNPLDGTITPYYAENIKNKMPFNSVGSLLAGTPYLENNRIKARFNKRLSEGKLKLLDEVQNSNESDKAIQPKDLHFVTDTRMYGLSNVVKTNEFLIDNGVIRGWNDQVLSAFDNEKPVNKATRIGTGEAKPQRLAIN